MASPAIFAPISPSSAPAASRKIRRSRKICDKPVASQPDFAPANALLGLYLSSRRQNGDEALMYAKKAVSLEPGNTEFIYDLAQVLAQMQRFDEAQYVAERARVELAERGVSRENRPTYRLSPERSQYRQPQCESKLRAETTGDSGSRRPTASMAQEEAPKDGVDNSREVTGVVMQESCAGGLKLQVAVATELFTFRLQPGAHSAIHMMTKPAPDFDICKSLKGTQVAVRFIPDDANKNSGAIQLLTILAADTSCFRHSFRNAAAGSLDHKTSSHRTRC